MAFVAFPSPNGGVADHPNLGPKDIFRNIGLACSKPPVAALAFEEENLEDTWAPFSIVCKRGYVGEWEMVCPTPRIYSTRSETESSMLSLPRQSFMLLSGDFPPFFLNVKERALVKQRLRQRQLQELRVALDYRALACTRVQAVWRSRQTRRNRQVRWRRMRNASKVLSIKVDTCPTFSDTADTSLGGPGSRQAPEAAADVGRAEGDNAAGSPPRGGHASLAVGARSEPGEDSMGITTSSSVGQQLQGDFARTVRDELLSLRSRQNQLQRQQSEVLKNQQEMSRMITQLHFFLIKESASK